ncbi:MAG TPA: response regulator [Candidatus Acidoferrales bacterium]|nr:response regulator [Candidatus Acidoferrales bacterium]
METILVVEDNEEIAALLKFKLTHSGYQVVQAENGKAGLEVAKRSRPDLIILDVMMPIMNGLEMMKALKSDEALKAIPVIILTALSNESEIVEGLDLGADDYITKPFRVQEFAARVGAVLARCQISNHSQP